METRRDFLKKGAYAAPIILTVAVRPSFGRQTYQPERGNNGVGNGIDGPPPGNDGFNDVPGTGPGNPGARP